MRSKPQRRHSPFWPERNAITRQDDTGNEPGLSEAVAGHSNLRPSVRGLHGHRLERPLGRMPLPPRISGGVTPTAWPIRRPCCWCGPASEDLQAGCRQPGTRRAGPACSRQAGFPGGCGDGEGPAVWRGPRVCRCPVCRLPGSFRVGQRRGFRAGVGTAGARPPGGACAGLLPGPAWLAGCGGVGVFKRVGALPSLAGPRSWWCVRRCPTLPHPPGCSTIGAAGLSFRVRDGSGRFPRAVAAATLVPCAPGCFPGRGGLRWATPGGGLPRVLFSCVGVSVPGGCWLGTA